MYGAMRPVLSLPLAPIPTLIVVMSCVLGVNACCLCDTCELETFCMYVHMCIVPSIGNKQGFLDQKTCAEFLENGKNVTKWDMKKDVDFAPRESVKLFDMIREPEDEDTKSVLSDKKWSELGNLLSTIYRDTIEKALKIPDSVAVMVRCIDTYIHVELTL